MALKMYQSSVQKAETKIKTVLGIAAGKGGVGKSTVTVNLALALKRMGFHVGILDSDIYGPSIRKMLPEETLPLQKGDRLMPACSQGIKLISMAYFRRENEAAAVRAPIANSLVTQFIKNVEWGEIDFLLIDFPPGTGDVQLTLSQQANLAGAIMVTTPQEVAMMDVRKAMHLFEQVNIPILGIVENMSFYQPEPSQSPLFLFGKGGGEILAAEKGVPFLAAIPIDSAISLSGDQGVSLFDFVDGVCTLSVQAFLDLAKKVVEAIPAAAAKAPEIKQLWQNEQESFMVQWSDGIVSKYVLSYLQKQCPCAGCSDEKTGRRLSTAQKVQEGVFARNISQVGRYALRIEFSSGCSNGIFSFDMLRECNEC